ncbi:hypothetical protein ASF53_13970 [Methylobacterium sp. Leaf123]|uniref:hypothetical protein n=1 Tax=Methylobacterium sp. Leaf123 TaxID=1736264 RepID=UPI0007001BAB|nr:hypothetical protein [Methylobacterium sp. Leaf123]KQQ13277.1 hypothetical protein ASF53_13970 [Methylobacterium sp. Leaf123]
MVAVNQIRDEYRLEAKTVGVDQAKAAAEGLAGATDKVAASSERQERKVISVQRALERFAASNDQAFRAQQQVERAQALVMGPWGAVIGAGAGLIGGLLGKSQAKKAAEKKIREQLEAYKEAYRQAEPEIKKLQAALREIYRIVTTSGIHNQVVVIPDPTDTESVQRDVFIGTIGALPSLRRSTFRRIATSFKIKEAL